VTSSSLGLTLYGVRLDGDPKQPLAVFTPGEIEPAL
jgi:hypothetical protein